MQGLFDSRCPVLEERGNLQSEKKKATPWGSLLLLVIRAILWRRILDIQILHIERILFDEFAARFNVFAH